MPNEIEILITAKNMGRAAFAGARDETAATAKAADDMDLAMRRAGLSAAVAGDNAERAMARAASAADKAAASQKAAADAAVQLERGEMSAADATKAEAAAQKDAAAARDAAVRSMRAQERAQLATASAARKAEVAQAAAAASSETASGRMAAGLSRLQKVGKVALEGITVGAVAVGYESTKMASKFQASMELLNTQAHVAQDKLKGLGDGVLKLAGQVGQSPDSLAEALYHVESNMSSMGISSQKALQMVKTAAEGASVGKADLVDVTNALTAAVAAQIPGVNNLDQAMGMLNATVGAGDMKMQDLSDAMGTGMVAVVKGYGLSLRDVGAALATFGDNNIRGAKAGTDLRMAVQALAVPAKTAAADLKRFGMNTTTLAKDMQSGGLLKAVGDLKHRMDSAGLSAKQQGQVITDMFGKKAGSGIDILIGQFDRLSGKYPEIDRGAKEFGSAWQQTQKTFSEKVDQIKNALEALGIQIGQKLLPVLSSMLGWFTKHTGTLKAFAVVIGTVLVTAILAYAAAMTQAAIANIAATWEILAIVAAVAALVAGIMYAYKHFSWFRDAVKAVGKALKTAWLATWHGMEAAGKWFVNGPLKWLQERTKVFTTWWHQNGKQVESVARETWKIVSSVIKAGVEVWWNGILKPTLTILEATWKLVWGIVRDTVKMVWHTIYAIVSTSIHEVLDIISIVLDLLTGKWGKAWKDLKKLASDAFHGTINTIKAIGSGLGTLLWDAGKNLVMGLVHGIEAVGSAPYNALSGIVGSLRGLLPFSPAKTGPLSGAGSPDLAGKKIATMLADGITGGTSTVVRASHKMAAAVTLPGTNSMRPLAAPIPTGMGGPINVQLQVTGGDSEAGKFLALMIRKWVRVTAGTGPNSVQKAFGG